eukprot:TRINITY_DN7125_c0_g1_i1.p1 TRINITY_DN7125_c0_g1~~TRINITY_DN7125_c0_g1_i1.p1  ORF type:complete len:225 (-),score=34.08 TRINITY_DN7125_c0_g1_i1:35-622(-)
MAQHEGACSHDHSCEDHQCAAEWSLYKHVDVPKVRALNEAVDGSAQLVFKPWDRRLDFSTSLESNDDDPELIVFIPFTSDVKIKSICVIGAPEGRSPAEVRAFINRDDVDFTSVREIAPIQEWRLAENTHGNLEYSTRYAKFQGVASLTLHFPSSFDGDKTCIYFIGLRGEATQHHRDKVAAVVYEAMPRPEDHK